MPMKPHRRTFLQSTAATGIGYWVAGGVARAQSTSPNEQIQFACIGVGGKGRSDSADAGRHGKVVGICDIDQTTLDRAAARFSEAEKYFDFIV